MSELLKSNKGVTFEIAGEKVNLTFSMVRNYLTRGNDNINEQEAVMFMNLCKYQKLNPFLNEAYLVKFKGSPAQIITSKEAYMKKAENNKYFDGFRAGLIIKRNEDILEIVGSFTQKGDVLLGGWAEVFRKDRKYPYISKVSLDEYDKGMSTWKKMTKTMIRKVAIVQALREAFPTDLGALYTEEESNNLNEKLKIDETINQEIKENANQEELKLQIEEPEETQEDIPAEIKEEETIKAPEQEEKNIKIDAGF